jgi:aspartokinase
MITATGSISQILRQLAWENINIVEVVSTRQELTIIVSAVDADKAFSVLHTGSY